MAIDLTDILSEKEKKELKDAKAGKNHRPRASVVSLPSPETVLDWVPTRKVLFWRKWMCTCGAIYSGPAYDANPVFQELERMQTRYYSPQKGEFRTFSAPRKLKKRTVRYVRDYSEDRSDVEVQTLETLLWSCPECQKTVRTSRSMATPCANPPKEVDATLHPEPKKTISALPTLDLEPPALTPREIAAQYESLGIEVEE